MSALTLALLLSLATDSARAAPATCRDYTDAQGADRALIDGFIAGYVAARLEGRPAGEVDATTLQVRQLAGRFCMLHPDERAIDVIGTLSDMAAGHTAPR